MRTIAALFLSLAACGGAAVCSGCADDAGGWSRDELPANGNLRLTVVAINGTDQVCQWTSNDLELLGFGVVMLNSDAPTAFGGFTDGPQPCSWDGPILSCAYDARSLSMTANLETMTAIYADGMYQCALDLTIDEVHPR